VAGILRVEEETVRTILYKGVKGPGNDEELN
jgi:hypothetical protein